jgi:hypothetical protein
MLIKFRDRGDPKGSWLQGNCLSIPTHGGRKVKKPYLDNLIKFIDFKHWLDEQES